MKEYLVIISSLTEEVHREIVQEESSISALDSVLVSSNLKLPKFFSGSALVINSRGIGVVFNVSDAVNLANTLTEKA